MRRFQSLWWLGLFAIALVACGPVPLPRPVEVERAPAGFPEAYYRHARAEGREVLTVDAARSLVTIDVRRAGALARLGHDHVVASHAVKGFVAPREGRADLYVALDDLVVDESGLRADAGFDTQPSKEAIEGTRHNMLKLLEAERFPFVLIRADRRNAETLRIALTLHGVSRELDIPALIERLPDGLAVNGRLSFKQSDFGIVPISVLGGALQVQDQLDLRFRIVALVPGRK